MTRVCPEASTPTPLLGYLIRRVFACFALVIKRLTSSFCEKGFVLHRVPRKILLLNEIPRYHYALTAFVRLSFSRGIRAS